jgi:hypothetical protein
MVHSWPHSKPFPSDGSLHKGITIGLSVAEARRLGSPIPRKDVIGCLGRVELLWAAKA